MKHALLLISLFLSPTLIAALIPSASKQSHILLVNPQRNIGNPIKPSMPLAPQRILHNYQPPHIQSSTRHPER
ncbi:MAG: hypothetical protein NTW08_02785 [Gammaproteobacteria bacterium]|nr:hypothetical protein [Gammaproteobacteria bacterium]